MMRQIHWTAPALMVGSLIVGVLFALGHHLFYASLDRKHASTSLDGYDVLGMHVSTQQSNTAIGTAFAFLVRACLLLSISTAYFQILIWSVRKHETRGTKLVHLDVMTSALNDLLSLASFKIWWRRPWLWVLAVIAWYGLLVKVEMSILFTHDLRRLIPLASIITPATLSVGVDSPSPIYMNVPNVEFSSLNLVAPMADNSLSSSDETTDTPFNFMYAGPSLTVQRIAKAVAAQGAILPVVAPAVNSSWDYDFHGPSLRCQPTSSGFRNDVLENILTYTFARKPVTGRTNCTFGPAYVAWHPGFMSPDDSMSEYLPFNIHNLNASRDPLNDDNSHGYPIADMASIFLAITPTLFSSALKEDLDTFDGPAIYHGKPWYQAGLDKYHGTSTVLRCNMHNSTYRTTFSFVNGVQEIIVESVKDVTNTPMITTGEVQVFFNSPDQADQSLRPQACPSSDPEKSKSACVTDPLALPTLSYQAVMHAFQDLVTGMISLGDREDLLTFVTSTTQLSSTILADAPELAFLESPQTYPGLRPSMQQRAATWEQQPFTGLLNARASTNSTLPFQQALEQLFQNITLSLMSAPELQ